MSKTGTVRLVLPLKAPPLSLNDQRRAHWTKVRDAKTIVELLVWEAAKKAKLKKIDHPVTVTLYWYAPDAHHRDCDNMAPMMKAALDALVKKGIIPDDNSTVVQSIQLGPIIISRDNPRMELHIQAARLDD